MARRAALVPLAVLVGLVGLVAGGLAACSVHVDLRDPGPRTTQHRDVTDVRALDLGASGDVHLSVGAPSLTVTGGADVLTDLTTTVRGDTLVVDLTGHWFDPGSLTYDLTLPALSSITLRGSGTVTGDVAGTGDADLDVTGSGRIDLAALDAGALRVGVTGSGEVTVGRVTATSAVVEIAGSGHVRLTGTTDTIDVSIPGSGAVDAGAFQARDARVSIAGSGTATVAASGTLDASVAGSGEVTYLGDPRVTSHVGGSGGVRRG